MKSRPKAVRALLLPTAPRAISVAIAPGTDLISLLSRAPRATRRYRSRH